MDSTTEKNHIYALSNGDKQAFEALFLHYYPRIKGFIGGILQNEKEAEDISQDIFVGMWQNRENLVNIEKLNSYLFRIAKNAVFRHIERSLLFKDYLQQQSIYPYSPKQTTSRWKKKSMPKNWNTLSP